jgi:hypothetical protein
MTDDGRKGTDVLARAQRAWSPSTADQERVRQAIGSAIAAGAPASVPPAVPRASGWGARLLAAGTIAAVSGGIGYWAGHRAGLRETSPVALVAPSAPTAASDAPPAPPSAPTKAPSVTAPAPSAARHGGHLARHETESSAPNMAESLAVEVRALRNAERALRDGNPGLALTFLAELDRQVPNGELTEERDAAATLARCARGDRPMGVDLAADFAERHPSSVYRARVEQTCAATDSPTAGDSARRRLEQ